MNRFSLRWKISGILIFSNLFLGILITYIVNNMLTETLENELIERGRAIGQDLARYSAPQILEEDVVGLKQIITSALAYESVEYVLIQNSESRMISDTYNGQVPPELTERSIFGNINYQKPQIVFLKNIDEECYDINIPVEEGDLGYVRIGMRKSYIDERVQKTNNYVLLTVVIVTLAGIIIVYFLANKIIRPILYLTKRANEISTGKLEEKVSVDTRDEIKDLANAVERLRESLNLALERLKKHQTLRI